MSYFYFLLHKVLLHFYFLHHLVLLFLFFLSEFLFELEELSSDLVFTIFWNFFDDSQSIFGFVDFLVFPLACSFTWIRWVAASSGWCIVISIWCVGIKRLILASSISNSYGLRQSCRPLVKTVLFKTHALSLVTTINCIKLQGLSSMCVVALTHSMVPSWSLWVHLFKFLPQG